MFIDDFSRDLQRCRRLNIHIVTTTEHDAVEKRSGRNGAPKKLGWGLCLDMWRCTFKESSSRRIRAIWECAHERKRPVFKRQLRQARFNGCVPTCMGAMASDDQFANPTKATALHDRTPEVSSCAHSSGHTTAHARAPSKAESPRMQNFFEV